jgi:peptidyl-prolyl cis-trans isomerase C
MNLLNKKNILALALAIGLTQWQLAANAATSGSQSGELFPDPVVAKGTGFEIKRSELDDAYLNASVSLAASGQNIPDSDRSMVRSNLLQHLIALKLMAQKATPEDRAAVTKLVEKNIIDARNSASSPEIFDAQIKASGMTLEQVRSRAFDEQLFKRVLIHETTNGITISDDSVKKFYDDNPSAFDVPEQVRVSHILILSFDPLTRRALSLEDKKAKEKLAKELFARAVAGEDFAKLVKEYSEAPSGKDNGEYKFARNQTTLPPEFEAAAFSLKTNQISEIVETRYGYEIIKLLERFPARHEAFAEVKGRIKTYLVDKEGESKALSFIEKAKADAHVAILETNSASP